MSVDAEVMRILKLQKPPGAAHMTKLENGYKVNCKGGTSYTVTMEDGEVVTKEFRPDGTEVRREIDNDNTGA